MNEKNHELSPEVERLAEAVSESLRLRKIFLCENFKLEEQILRTELTQKEFENFVKTTLSDKLKEYLASRGETLEDALAQMQVMKNDTREELMTNPAELEDVNSMLNKMIKNNGKFH